MSFKSGFESRERESQFNTAGGSERGSEYLIPLISRSKLTKNLTSLADFNAI